MARLIRATIKPSVKAIIRTCFEDGSVSDKVLKVGDVVENLRYVESNDIAKVSGTVIAINYTMASKVSFKPSKPEDTFANDCTINNIKIRVNTADSTDVVVVPAMEILEDDGVENVERMRVLPELECYFNMYYSNYSVAENYIKAGDILSGAKIMGEYPGSLDKTGEFDVIGFAYNRESNTKCRVTGIALKSEKYGTFVADFERILNITEAIQFETETLAEVMTAIAEMKDGDIVKIGADLDTNGDNVISVNGKSITLDFGGNTMDCGNGKDNGVVVENGKLEIKNAIVVSNNPFVKGVNDSAMINVLTGGELVLEDCTFTAVLENPVDNGQYGIQIKDTGKVIIEDGTKITAGWFCINGNGNYLDADNNGVMTVNGGDLCSTVDYAIYQGNNGLTVINGGYVHGGAGAISLNAGKCIINGGVIESVGTGDTGVGSDGTCGQANAVINLNAKYTDIALEIHGGTFKNTGNVPLIIVNDSAHAVNIKIDGGLFTVRPEDAWIAEGYVCPEEVDEDGYFYVVKQA